MSNILELFSYLRSRYHVSVNPPLFIQNLLGLKMQYKGLLLIKGTNIQKTIPVEFILIVWEKEKKLSRNFSCTDIFKELSVCLYFKPEGMSSMTDISITTERWQRLKYLQIKQSILIGNIT